MLPVGDKEQHNQKSDEQESGTVYREAVLSGGGNVPEDKGFLQEMIQCAVQLFIVPDSISVDAEDAPTGKS